MTYSPAPDHGRLFDVASEQGGYFTAAQSAARFRQALEQRLADRTRATGASLVRLRKTVAFDRLLARLTAVAPGRWVLAGLDGERLRDALHGTFEGRRQQAMPGSLPPPPAEWSVAYRKLAIEVGLDPDLAAGYREAAALLDPVLAGVDSGRWDAMKGCWV